MKQKTKNTIFTILLFLAIVLDAVSTNLASAIPFLGTISNTIWAIIEGGILTGLFIINKKQ